MPASGDASSIASLLRKNKRLARELSRMDAVFNAIHSAIVVCDDSGEILFANSFADSLLGLNPSSGGVCIFKLLPGMDDALAWRGKRLFRLAGV